jgi:hypothetical protein
VDERLRKAEDVAGLDRRLDHVGRRALEPAHLRRRQHIPDHQVTLQVKQELFFRRHRFPILLEGVGVHLNG